MGHHFGWGGGIAGFYTEKRTTLGDGNHQAGFLRDIETQTHHMHQDLFKVSGKIVNNVTNAMKDTEVTMVGVRLRNKQGIYVSLKALYKDVSNMRESFVTYYDDSHGDTGVPKGYYRGLITLQDAVDQHDDLQE